MRRNERGKTAKRGINYWDGRVALICSWCKHYNSFPSIEAYKEHLAKEHPNEREEHPWTELYMEDLEALRKKINNLERIVRLQMCCLLAIAERLPLQEDPEPADTTDHLCDKVDKNCPCYEAGFDAGLEEPRSPYGK